MSRISSDTSPRVLHIDLETYSDIDLQAAGVHPYTESDAFEILLLAYAWGDDPVRVLDLASPGGPPEEYQDILAGLLDPSTLKVAHNATFERTCLAKHTGRPMPVEEWADTADLAAMHGLPRSLDACGAALGITNQKLAEGTALIRYFCKPCKPTVANGGRTRNLPEHAPEKWARFMMYCGRDVEAEQEIYGRLSGYPVTELERQTRAVDAAINARGVMIDRELVEAAQAVDDAFRAEHLAELRRLTGLSNPNSVAQLKDWLEAVGVPVDSLDKATVADLRQTVADPTIQRVLELRQLLGKTSTKKYEAMMTAACGDDRIRGLLQYYGAGRTGRWAGRLVQVQNLPQNHIDSIAKVRELVRARDLETLELLYDNVPDILSQLIRTAFVARPGHVFLVADYAAIEARVIAYLAGERWRMDVFASGGDIYCSSASQMFGVPVVKHGINGHLRQKGKVAELACIAEGQKVLTDHGLVPIEHVTAAMRVWDGVDWVRHDGVICKGTKEVFSYVGLEATADHIVWAEVGGQLREVYFGDAATCGARLAKTGSGRHPLRLGGNYQPRKTLERRNESLLRTDALQWLRRDTLDNPGQSAPREVQGLPELLAETRGASLAGSQIHRSKATLHKSAGRKLQKLRRPRHRVPVCKRDGRLSIHDRDAWAAITRYGAGQDRRGRTLRARKSALGDTPAKLPEPAPIHRKVRVYDLVNAGPRHRYTVSGVLVHNCGYGGGVGALKAFGADKMGLTEAEMQDIVAQWRQASPTIPRFWREAEKAARKALETPGRSYTIPCCGVRYYRDADALRCVLPSGRVLSYWGARLEDGQITFMGQNQTTRKWEKTDTWGGKLVENIVQAYARDCLAVALVRLDEAGWRVCFHVHDEVIVEAPEGSRWQDVAEIMGQPIDWAPGLLLRGDGFETKFYIKD